MSVAADAFSHGADSAEEISRRKSVVVVSASFVPLQQKPTQNRVRVRSMGGGDHPLISAYSSEVVALVVRGDSPGQRRSTA
jgi:hypothetical protein